MSIDILLADDHALTRAGLRSVLEAEQGVRVVGEAENGREAVKLAGELHPHVIVLDISMPELNGLDAAEMILRDHPQAKILILSMHADHGYIEQALRIGVKGYLLKDCATDEVLTALKIISRGSSYLSPGISDIVVRGFQRGNTAGELIGSFAQLTASEREVLQLVAEGHTTKEIADRLNLSVRAIEVRRKQIMDKLNLHTIAQLTKYAVKEGITTPEP